MARGREAKSSKEIPARGWRDIAFRVKDEISEDHIGLIAAGVAFYALLALFPAITAMVAISGLLVDPNQIIRQLEGFASLVPKDVLAIIIDQATAVAESRTGGLGLAAIGGILLALYSASKGMQSLMEGMNVAYDEEEERGYVRRMAITFGLTLLLIIGLIVALSMTIAVPAALALLNLGPLVAYGGAALSWLLIFVLAILGLAVIYRYGPCRDEPEWRWVSPGAVLACIVWLFASAGFAFYVGNFASYNKSFGALAGVIVLLMWCWTSAYIILLGAELNAEMEAQARVDTTIGPDEPMGQRGATKADRLGEKKLPATK